MTRISVEELLNMSESDDMKQIAAVSPPAAPRTLVFLTMSDNCKYSRQWSLNTDTARKLTLKEFTRYMKSKCTRIAHYIPKDPRIFYTDEEEDDIFVGSDDEYKEMVKVAINKNKEGHLMVINCVKKSTRKDGRRSDVLSRDSKMSPGKVTKSSPTKLRAKVPSKPISLTIRYSEDLKDLSDDLEKTKLSDSESDREEEEEEVEVARTSRDLRRQQAAVFDWMTVPAGAGGDGETPPAWFRSFMETFKEELVAEVSAKVVHSLGVVMDNKLTGLEVTKRTGEHKQMEKVVVGKVKKTRDSEKVKKEAMRMSMEINDEAESKELKKLRKSLVKKTDKVVKIAMKIEKKQNQEEKRRKPSIPSSGADIGMSFPAKKEKKCKKKKSKRCSSSDAADDGKETESCCEETIYPVLAKPTYPLSPVRSYPLVPVIDNYPIVMAAENKMAVLDKILCGVKQTIMKDLMTTKAAENVAVEIPSKAEQEAGKLANAVYVAEAHNYVKASAGGEVRPAVAVTNMSCLEWGEAVTLQQILATGSLQPDTPSLSLAGLGPGEERKLEVGFRAPAQPGLYESVWNFFEGEERFGPPVAFKILVTAASEEAGEELKDYNSGVEMKSLGCSAKSQEMVEMSADRSKIVEMTEIKKEVKVEEEVESGFDFLASEVDSITISAEKTKDDDDFEVIPIPDCFDLEVPFEMVENNLEVKKEKEDIVEVKGVTEVTTSTESLSTASENLIRKELTSMVAHTVPVSASVQQSTAQLSDRLVQLGFGNRTKNKQLLELHNNDIEQVLQIVFEDNNVDWAAARH